MSPVASVARSHLLCIITARFPGLPLKSAIPRVAALLRFTSRRVETLWSMSARRIDADEMAALEREMAAISERALTLELHQHANRLEYYAAQLAAADFDGNRPEILRLRNLARRARTVLDPEGA